MCERNGKKRARVNRPKGEDGGTRGRESKSTTFDQSFNSENSGRTERK